MYVVEVRNFSEWRAAARPLLAAHISPAEIVWGDSRTPLVFSDSSTEDAPEVSGDVPVTISRQLMKLLEEIAVYRDVGRWELMYRLAWRSISNRALLEDRADPDVSRAHMMEKAVHRDVHKMHAFVRFRETEAEDGEKRYVAWFEPAHEILQMAAPFFQRRFPNMKWMIATPDGAAVWDGAQLLYIDAPDRATLPRGDVHETLWRTYYRNVCNVARINTTAMQREMPQRYWRHLPEASEIAALLHEGTSRIENATRPAEQCDEDALHASGGTRPADQRASAHAPVAAGGMYAAEQCAGDALHAGGGTRPADQCAGNTHAPSAPVDRHAAEQWARDALHASVGTHPADQCASAHAPVAAGGMYTAKQYTGDAPHVPVGTRPAEHVLAATGGTRTAEHCDSAHAPVAPGANTKPLPRAVAAALARIAVPSDTPTACRRCDLWKRATQAVLGEGPENASIMLVGEQPGDEEDLRGRPFVGPAGRLLDHALKTAGVVRNDLFVTNAVKHFKWEPRGKRRLHKRPDQQEISACNMWLDQEIARVSPRVIVALGATALRALAGTAQSIESARRETFQHPSGAQLLITYHPSAILRAEGERAEQLRTALIEDLRRAQTAATNVSERTTQNDHNLFTAADHATSTPALSAFPPPPGR
jgi:probable DNA metabolism protein